MYFLFYLIAAYSYILLSYSALLPHSFGFCNPTCPWPLLHRMASFQLQVSWLSTSLSPCFPIQFPEGEHLMDQTHLFHSGPGFWRGPIPGPIRSHPWVKNNLPLLLRAGGCGWGSFISKRKLGVAGTLLTYPVEGCSWEPISHL